MDVAFIGADSPLGLRLQTLLQETGRHQVLPLSGAASRFKSERQAKKAVRRGNPRAVVDLRLAALFGQGEGLQEADIERCHWLAKACERSGMFYLLLSRDRVFSGLHHRPLRESDPTDSEDSVGLALIEAEGRVREAAPSACVLRTGPIFSGLGDALLSGTLDTLLESRNATFDDMDQFCPSGVDDVARVVAAVLDQVGVGASAAGVYQYSSADRTTRYGFAEVLLAAAGQYADLGDVTLSALGNAGEGRTRILDCNRLRDAFGIKQVSWRGFVSDAVKRYFDEKKEA